MLSVERSGWQEMTCCTVIFSSHSRQLMLVRLTRIFTSDPGSAFQMFSLSDTKTALTSSPFGLGTSIVGTPIFCRIFSKLALLATDSQCLDMICSMMFLLSSHLTRDSALEQAVVCLMTVFDLKR